MTPSRQIVIGSLLLLVLSGGAAWLAFQPSSSPEPLLKPDCESAWNKDPV